MPFIDTHTLETRCYRNRSTHVVGVIKLREYDGKPNGIGLKPGEKTHLNTIEERLTRNAPRSEADNPFANGELELVDEATEGLATVEAEEIAAAEEPETETEPETPATPEPGAPKEPNADLPPGAIPGAQDPRAQPAPGTLEEVAAEAAKAAEESGEPPTDEEHAVSAASAVAEETGVKIDPADQEEVAGERAAAEEVATPDAAPKPRRQSGNRSKAKK